MSEYYKNKRKIELQVGLFIIILVMVLVTGYNWLRSSMSLKNKVQVQVLFSNAKSVMKGDIVTCYGVSRGKVSEIVITKKGALMTIAVEKDVPLTQNTQFIIKETDLMGSKQIDILPGNSDKMLDLSIVHDGKIQQGITSAIAKGYQTIEKINILLNKMTEEQGIVENSSKLISETSSLIANLKEQLPNLLNKLSGSIADVNEITTSINSTISDNEEYIQSTIKILPEAVSKLNDSLNDITKITSNIATISDSMLTKDNSLRLLLQDDKLYYQLRDTANSADSLLQDIKANPKKYLELKVF